jgi:methylamine dehydrogenase accessory protein MauD
VSGLWAASYAALWLLVVVLTLCIGGLMRQIGLLQLRLGPEPGVLVTRGGLDRGTKAPDFSAADAETRQIVENRTFLGRRAIVVFLSVTCSACIDLIPGLNEVARDYAGEINFLTLCEGTEAGCAQFRREYGLDVQTLADKDGHIAESFEVPVEPFAYLVDEQGVVLLRGIVNTRQHIESLIREEGTLQRSQGRPADSNGSQPLIVTGRAGS